MRIAKRDKLGQPPPYVDHHSATKIANVSEKGSLTSGHEGREIPVCNANLAYPKEKM